MIKIELEGGVRSRQVRGKDGTSFEVRDQIGLIHIGRQVRKCVLRIEAGQAPRPAGLYTVGDESFSTDGYDNVVVDRLVLEPYPGKGA